MKRLLTQAQPAAWRTLSPSSLCTGRGPCSLSPNTWRAARTLPASTTATPCCGPFWSHRRLHHLPGAGDADFPGFGGLLPGRADIVRRAMAKKKHDVLEREREVFLHGQVGEGGQVEIDGCLRRGVDEATAQALFQEIESFASYAFNKSHAAGYAVVPTRRPTSSATTPASTWPRCSPACWPDRQGVRVH